ncbi:hypothetical protein TRIUR3_04566 [Triticum urartu]|uniref:Uncharacterized protein n=1 Tax=Triticum urartu TaxID=4572 RepID=M8AHJ3_TRIUA|nr:hypothetical protein TRIUR3_04566 [Triticum urartu]
MRGQESYLQDEEDALLHNGAYTFTELLQVQMMYKGETVMMSVHNPWDVSLFDNMEPDKEPEESAYDTSATQATEKGLNLQATERSEETEKQQ